GGAQAQTTVRGTVQDDSGAPLSGVQIYSPAGRRGTLSGAGGGFVLSPLPRGTVELHFTHIGFAPRRVTLEVGPASGPLTVRLERTPLALPGMEVTATPSGRDPLAVTQATSQIGGAALE